MDGIVAHSKGDAIAYPKHIRSVGIAIAPRRYRNMSPGPRTRTVASECVSIMPDGTRKIFKAAKRERNVAGITRRVSTKDNAAFYDNLLRTVGATGNID